MNDSETRRAYLKLITEADTPTKFYVYTFKTTNEHGQEVKKSFKLSGTVSPSVSVVAYDKDADAIAAVNKINGTK